MDFNPNDASHRTMLINAVDDTGEKGRKYESFKQWEIYQDRIRDFVVAELREQFDEDTVKENPIVSSVNTSKRVVNQTSVVYNQAPKRSWSDLTDDQKNTIKLIYDDMRANKKFGISNKGYKLQDQSHLWIMPVDGKLEMRVLKNHQLTVIPNAKDPEKAAAYIVSSMPHGDFVDQEVSLETATGFTARVDNFEDSLDSKNRMDQEKAAEFRHHIVWTPLYNFALDNQGNLVSEIFPNPLAEFGMMPFVEISWEKEFEYWVRKGTGDTDFCVELNTRLSEVALICKMQGFSQAVLKGPKSLIAQNVTIGPTKLLKIETDPATGVDGEFSFANTGADINGCLDFINALISFYLSSKGLDPSTVTSTGQAKSYTSGLERLLAMISELQVSAEDFDIYTRAEERTWEIIKAWLSVLSDTDALDEKYRVPAIPEESQITVEYKKPTMIQSEKERLDTLMQKIELGISSPIEYLMETQKIERDEALELYNTFQAENRRQIIGGQE